MTGFEPRTSGIGSDRSTNKRAGVPIYLVVQGEEIDREFESQKRLLDGSFFNI